MEISKNIIEISNLEFQISTPDHKKTIKYPEISIPYNKTTFITGASGIGKSTLLKLINLVRSPKHGNIIYNQKNITTINPIELRKEVILCNQEVFLFDDTIKGNYNAFYECRDIPTPSTQQIKEFLDICCINFDIDTDCFNMSGGEKHRVFISVCLSFSPKILMLDEPTAALDLSTSHNLLSNIKNYCKDKEITLLIVCHSPEIVEKYADNVVNL